jgi:hypothetical protein
MPLNPDLEQRSQQTLIDFLSTDIELCLAILESARLTSDPDHYTAALARVRSGLTTIRNFTGRVQDRTTWSELHARADELEHQLGRLSAERQ